jgi:voltage-gated potassium channel
MTGIRTDVPSILRLTEEERAAWSEELLDRLTPVMSALSVLFLLVVIGEYFAQPGSALSVGFTVLGWLLWVAFVAEFLARLTVAPDTGRFLRKNWWQVVFLLLPFLRILRLARSLRALRTGRVLSSAVRSSRSARRMLGGRVAWLAVASGIAILAGSQLLYEFGSYSNYADALRAATLATVGGEPFSPDDPFSHAVEVVLVVFSVVVFATLAGAIGAYFLESGQRRSGQSAPSA